MAAERIRRTNEGFYTKENKREWKDRREGRRKNSTDIVFWNVAGVTTLSKDTWEEIKEFEIIGLTETWLKEKNEKILDRHLQGYDRETIAAKVKRMRHSRRQLR